MAIPFLQSISVPGLLLNGFGTGVLISTSGTVSALSGTNLVLANGSTLAQSTLLSISAVNNGGPTETLISRIRSDSTQLATLSWDGANMVFNRSPLISTLAGGSTGMVGVNSSGVLFRATAGTDYVIPGSLTAYLPLAGGTMTGSITTNNPNNILNPTSYSYIPTDNSPFTQSFITSYGSHDWSAYTAPVQEKTADGTTWVADTLATKLFDAYPSTTSVIVLNTTTPLYGTRWTWNTVAWSNITKIMLTYAYSGTVPVFNQIVETSPDGTTWTSVGTTTSYDSTRPTIISIGAVGPNAWLRVTMVRVSGTGTIPCNSVQLWSTRLGDQGKGKWNYLPFSWDYNKKLIANTVNADQAYIGKWVNDGTYARMGHVSYNTSTGFGYMQTSDGRVFASSNTSVTVRIGADDLLITTSTGNTLLGTTTLGTLNGILKTTSGVVSTAVAGTDYVIPTDLANYQPLDGDLTAIATLAGTSGLARKTAANTWSLDTATYLTANQTITLSGIITGSGTTAITTAIADAALSIAKTSGLQAALDAKMDTTSYPDLVAIEALAGTTGLARKTAANTWSLDTATYLTANQTVTLSGIITGSGTTAITTAIADAALSIAKTSGLQTALDTKMMKISASSAAASVANTTTTTAILSTSLVSANQAPGTLMDITCEGTMRFATLSDTITFTLLLGSVTLGTFTIVGTDITGSAINTDYHYKLTGRLSPQTGPGASSNVGFYGVFTVMGTTASTVVDIAVIGTAINTTVSNNVIINVAWSAAATNNAITTNYNYVGKLA